MIPIIGGFLVLVMGVSSGTAAISVLLEWGWQYPVGELPKEALAIAAICVVLIIPLYIIDKAGE